MNDKNKLHMISAGNILQPDIGTTKSEVNCMIAKLTCNIEGVGNTIASAGELVKIQYSDENGIMVQTLDGRVSFYAEPDEIAVEI